MLKFLNQDRCIHSVCNCQLPLSIFSETAEDHVHIPICSCDSNMLIKRCCLQNQRPNTCLPPLSVCVTNMDCLSCQSVAVGHFNTVVSKRNPVPCSPHGCCPEQLQQCKIHLAKPALCMHLCSTGQKTNKADRARSPSPPSLSPVETDKYDSLEESIEDSLSLGNTLEMNSNQPPSLLPAEKSFSACEQKDNICITEGAGNLDETLLSANQENSLINSDKLEQVENSPFQDLMDRINEKLKSIETTDTTNVTRLSKSDGKTEADTKLRSFITSLLHDAKPNDYSFMELLNQHDKEIESKIIQTRFRKRQETLFAMHKSPDSSLFRRQSLQIKRELASLDETFIRKKASSERSAKKLTKNDKLSPNKIAHHSTLNNLALQNHENKEKLFSSIKSKSLPVCPQESLELPLNNSGTNSSFVAFSENNSTTSQTHLVEIHGNCGVDLHMDPVPVKRDDNRLLDRTKHTVIPPMWCSVYVTNNFLANPHPYCTEKDKTLIDFQAKTCSSEDINKVVRNTNLHVVVERLEDTLNMAQKAKKPFFNGYTITSKLKDIHKSDANKNSKSGLFFSMSETGSKGQYVLSQAHVPFSSKECMSTKEKEITDRGYKTPWKSSNTFDSDVLTSNNEDLQRSSDAGDNSSTTLNYTSPIKLMFLSEINSSEGVKYTLKSVNDSSKLNIDFYSLHEKTNVPSEKQSETRDLGKNVSIEECSYSENGNKDEVNSVFPTTNETSISEHRPSEESIEQSCNGSSLKRKPGRPKKIGPQVVKQFKRPIGRPPKPKVAAAENTCRLSNSTSSKKSGSSNAGVLEEESINKNITVTIVFGRSRRTKRCVSEGTVSVVSVVRDPHRDCDVLCESAQLKNSDTRESLFKNNSMPNSASGYEYVRPLESSPVVASHCSNIIRPNQKPLNIIRKPGRPAKVKISGISVTVNQISSQERKVSISSCLPPLEKETVLEKKESFKKENNECNKRYVAETILNDTDEDFSREKILASKKPEIPLRQSVRDRRPSLPFLHSLASASPLSCRRAFLQKSYKFCLKNVKNQKIQHHSSMMPKHTSINKDPENAKKSAEHNKFRSIHEMSLDPIVSSNSLRWWDPSISNDSLLKELNSRYDQITSTWLNVNGEEFGKRLYDEECHTKQDCSISVSNPLDSCILQLEHSPIKMLFQKECNIDDLRTWFMQTTETQSLSLVRKANARNPFEVISTKQFKMGTRQYDCNTSPLRKHFKKFALSTPSKSAGDLQILHKIGRSQVLNRKHKYTLAKLRKNRFENGQRDRWRQVKKLYSHGTSDWKSKRRNLRFFCRSQCFANGNRKISNHMCVNHRNCTVQSNSSSVLIEPHTVTSSTGNEIRDASYQQKTQSCGLSTNPELKNNCTSSIQPDYCNQENSEKVRAPGWRDKTFKNCRIFLKKINPVEEQLSFNTNPVVCTPESVSHSYFQEKRHCTLRSHSTKQSMSDSYEKDAETSKAAKYSTLVKGMHVEQDSKKSSKRVTFDDGPTEVPTKINKWGKTQCKLTDLDVRKRNKKQLCKAGQVSSCFSKYQIATTEATKRGLAPSSGGFYKIFYFLPDQSEASKLTRYRMLLPPSLKTKVSQGPLKPVGLPLLGGFASRAVEYSMIPFQLPLHGSSHV